MNESLIRFWSFETMRVFGDKFISVATLVCVSILSATVKDLCSSSLVGEFYLGTFEAAGFFFS
jgi:hypothetical protein